MSIDFYMWRITPDAYRESITDGTVPETYITENDQISKGWGQLLHILADGEPTSTALTAQAINGGELLRNEALDYNGVRAHSPERVTEISAALNAFPPTEFERRYRTLAFTDVYGSEADRPVSSLESLKRRFEVLRNFYTITAESGNAMIIWRD